MYTCFWFPDRHLTWSISIQQVLRDGGRLYAGTCAGHTHTVKQMAVKSLVMSLWVISVAAWKYLLIYVSSLIFNFLGFLLLVRHTVFLLSTCVIMFLHVLFTVLFTNTGLLGAIDLLPAWKYPNGQLIHVKRTMISGWLLQHVVSATVAEGGYKSKEEHQA